MTGTTPNDLQNTLKKAVADCGGTISDTNLQKLVDSVIATLQKANVNVEVFTQLTQLSEYIASSHKELAAIHADAISDEHIPAANDQLDQVVGATEEATNKIMDCCDRISTIAGELPADANGKLMEQVTGIYEACNFQDITGQRITKVVRTLKHIEGQILTLVKSLEQMGFQMAKVTGQKLDLSKATDPDKHLLNGPQAGADAIKQDDIDKLFG